MSAQPIKFDSAKNEQLSYNQTAIVSPKYKYVTVAPNTFGQTITLTNSTQNVKFLVQAEPYNWCRSMLQGTLVIPAQGANNYGWFFADVCFGLISYIFAYTANGQRFVDLNDAHLWLHGPAKYETSLEEFLTYDILSGQCRSESAISVQGLTGFSQYYSLPSAVNAGTNDFFNLTSMRNNMISPLAQAEYNASVSYTEPAYYGVGEVNAPITIQFRYPLGRYKQTFFAIDKSTYFGGALSNLECTMGPSYNLGYYSTINNSPVVNATYALGGVTGQFAVNPTVANFQLLMAQDVDPETLASTKAEFASKKMLIPFIRCEEYPCQGQAQTVPHSYTSGDGIALMKVYHQVYSAIRQGTTVYDCSNDDLMPSNVSATNTQAKISSFQTQLNGLNLQDLALNCTSVNVSGNGANLDYLHMEDKLKGSMIQSRSMYYYNWAWCDDFVGAGAMYNQDNDNSIIGGKQLTAIPLIWSIKANMTALAGNATYSYIHVTFAILLRAMQIDNRGCTF